MNRVIKFRVLDIFKKVFIPNDVFMLTNSNSSSFAVMIKDWEDYKEGEYMYPNTQILIQFTGLLDVNGKEIYEGDCFKVVDREFYGIVKFKKGCWVVSFNDYDISLYEYLQNDPNRIPIGNLYENPELISKKYLPKN